MDDAQFSELVEQDRQTDLNMMLTAQTSGPQKAIFLLATQRRELLKYAQELRQKYAASQDSITAMSKAAARLIDEVNHAKQELAEMRLKASA